PLAGRDRPRVDPRPRPRAVDRVLRGAGRRGGLRRALARRRSRARRLREPDRLLLARRRRGADLGRPHRLHRRRGERGGRPGRERGGAGQESAVRTTASLGSRLAPLPGAGSRRQATRPSAGAIALMISAAFRSIASAPAPRTTAATPPIPIARPIASPEATPTWRGR